MPAGKAHTEVMTNFADSELLDCATWDEGSLRAALGCYEHTLERTQANINKINFILTLKEQS